MGNNEVITGTDYKRMIIGAYSEFILEYEKINKLKKNGRFFYCGKPGTDVLRTMGAAVLPLADSVWHGGWQMRLCWEPGVMAG